jgi:hypothetical protein
MEKLTLVYAHLFEEKKKLLYIYYVHEEVVEM